MLEALQDFDFAVRLLKDPHLEVELIEYLQGLAK